MEEPTMLNRELKKGSAELLILSILEGEPMHGYRLAKEISEQSSGILHFYPASLYPTLYRLEKRGWIEGGWIEEPGRRRKRFYRLTRKGVEVLAAQRSTWEQFAGAVNRIVGLHHA